MKLGHGFLVIRQICDLDVNLLSCHPTQCEKLCVPNNSPQCFAPFPHHLTAELDNWTKNAFIGITAGDHRTVCCSIVSFADLRSLFKFARQRAQEAQWLLQ